MANPYYVAPLGGLDVGAKIQSVIETGQERKRLKKMRERASGAISSGDPDIIAEFMVEYPEAAQSVSVAMGYKRQSAIQDRVDRAKDILTNGADPSEAIASHIQNADNMGEDVTSTINQLGKSVNDAEYGRQWAEKTLALFDPQAFSQYRAATVPEKMSITASQKDYALAKKEGFKGSFMDFKKALQFDPNANLETLKIQTQILDIQERIKDRKEKSQIRKEKEKELKNMKSKKDRNLVRGVDSLLHEVDKAVDMAKESFTATGITGAATSIVPGSPSYNLRRTVDTIKANLGFDQLQQMRDSSPTGGALGQVSERELNFLQSTLTALDPNMGDEQLLENLEKVKKHYNAWRDTMVGKMPEEAVQEQQKDVTEMSDEELRKALGGE